MPAPTAADRWTAELEAWAIPPAILDAAPRNPYELSGSMIRVPAVDPLATPTGAAVLERLAEGEVLLDVGCGAGRISGAFTGRHRVIGVEPRAALAATAAEVGIEVVAGRWPDAAAEVGTAPVVLCTHVLYDVQQPVPFLAALAAAATRRVVLEVTAAHPWARTGPLYRRFHDLDRPTGPTWEDLVAVVREELGVQPAARAWSRPGSVHPSLRSLADQTARMLCLPPTEEVLAQVADAVAPDVVVLPDGAVRAAEVPQATIWWDVDSR